MLKGGEREEWERSRIPLPPDSNFTQRGKLYNGDIAHPQTVESPEAEVLATPDTAESSSPPTNS
jgi:hypothetical protein